jgi:hypothetical protein
MLVGFIKHQVGLYPYTKKGEQTNDSEGSVQADVRTPEKNLQNKEEINTNGNMGQNEETMSPEVIAEGIKPPQESEGVYSNYLNLVKESRTGEKKGRSLSISSTSSSQKSVVATQPQNFRFIMRFPRELWEEAIQFITS